MSETTNTFGTKIKQFPFDSNGINTIKGSNKGEDWPVVYILSGEKEAYIGETQNAYNRMKQHSENPERKNLTEISLMSSDSFNKSAILDIENMLITHMHADGKFVLQNGNGGQSKLHNYYQRSKYQDCFADIWKKLRNLNLVDHDLFEVQNMEIFKYSPFKQLTSIQYELVEDLLNNYIEVMNSNKHANVVVNGGAGTGKTLVAIYFVNLLVNIMNGNYDTTDDDHQFDEDNFAHQHALIKKIKEVGKKSIGFVEPVPSFKETVKKLFRSIKELKNIDVISPKEATKQKYDILIVDEAHRLKRYNKLANYGKFKKGNIAVGLPETEGTELDWVRLQSNNMLILFYDSNQTVKESDVLSSDFDMIKNATGCYNYYLKSQLRVKGGNEYIDFVKQIFNDNPKKYTLTDEYDLKVFDNVEEMFDQIKLKNTEYQGLCRVLAGKSFEQKMQARDKSTRVIDYDFIIDGHKFRWNESFNDSRFITDDKYLDRVGCIYVCQGYDLNFAGVILGNDVKYNPLTKKIEFDISKFNDTYSKGKTEQETIENIINAYIVLLTRGIYGTYIFAVDKNLRDYIRSLLK